MSTQSALLHCLWHRRSINCIARSLGYSEECLGMHMGHLHDANLGDGNGRTTELFLARQYYFPVWGTCWESLAGALDPGCPYLDAC